MMKGFPVAVAGCVLAVVSASHAQTTQGGAAAPASSAVQAAPPPGEMVDVIDLLRKIRHKELTPEEQAAAADPATRMYAVAPVIGYKPSSGVMVGAAGNVAFYAATPETTHISSTVASVTVSSKKQVSLTAKFNLFGAHDRWSLDGDNRAQWTSQDTHGLGTSTTSGDKVNMTFDYFRVFETAYVTLFRKFLAGAGFHYSAHLDAGPGKDADAIWSDSPYVVYSEAHGFPLESQTSAGISVNLLVDTRDSTINADRGWLASASYRPFFSGFLGGDSTWQELYAELRTYVPLTRSRRHKLAFWVWGDLVVGGTAPYLDLPATGMDKYGRSARGYAEGRFRGERLLYGEMEYRGTLTSNGLIGMVLFLNTTTLENRASGERLFDGFAPGAGAGLRLLVNKRSKTNLCVDVGRGKGGSHGLYLSVQEAF